MLFQPSVAVAVVGEDVEHFAVEEFGKERIDGFLKAVFPLTVDFCVGGFYY